MTVTRKRCKFCQHEARDELESEIDSMSISCDDLDKREGWRSGTAAQHQRNHMGDYQNSSNPRCGFCTDPMRSHYEKALSSGEVTSEAIAETLSISKTQVQRHMKNHLAPLVQKSAANIIAKKEVNEIEMLSLNVQRLDAKVDELFGQDDLSHKELDALVKLAREVRESLKYIMEFKGKLVHRRQDTIIVHQMQVVQKVLAQNHPEVWLDVKKQMQEELQ
ncbi:MAG: hypothetical protein GOVbin4206_54 [Prokaryotic dsDNA virus sp.]|nr:MAG: hypothetical protein GOVbin4206_54 [Prokaryotic dsDNA virus sp.]